MLRSRDGGAQLYELVGFKYYGVYLAILDVYYAAGARQEVHCELAWSADFKSWHRIEEGHDLVPLGPEGSFESHVSVLHRRSFAGLQHTFKCVFK